MADTSGYMQAIQPGLKREETFRVEQANTARHIGSGSARVLATPWMVAFMERVAHRLLAERLPPGYSSVGVALEVRHSAPSPVGSLVRVQAEVVEVDATRVTFTVEATDEVEAIGSGRHERVVVEEARFLRRVQAKQAGRPESRAQAGAQD